MDKEKLFTDFPPVETESWMEKIKADLKGADFEKKLVWHTDEGLIFSLFTGLKIYGVWTTFRRFPMHTHLSEETSRREIIGR